MSIALPLARSLAGRFARAAAATALAATSLLFVAALVEGHLPRTEVLLRVVGPLAGALGACWALGDWRRCRADVATAALGFRGGWPVVGLALLATPLLATSPPEARAAAPMTVTPDRVVAHLPGGAFTWRWSTDGVERSGPDGAVVTMPALPRPAAGPAIPAPTLWRGPLARALALALALLVLSGGPTPGPTRVVAAATAAFVAGHALAWWFG